MSKLLCEGVVLYKGKGNYVVKGKLEINQTSNPIVVFWAPNKPTIGTSFHGSGLPYPNPEIAFESTPNKGAVKTKNGYFEFNVEYPNSFYVTNTGEYLSPRVLIRVCEKGIKHPVQTIKLGDGIPFRLLNYPPPPLEPKYGTPLFYQKERGKGDPKTQYQLLLSRSYPKKMPKHFWK